MSASRADVTMFRKAGKSVPGAGAVDEVGVASSGRGMDTEKIRARLSVD